MAWTKNKEDETRYADTSGELGGFGRVIGSNQTFTGPITSANGTKWFLIVDDLGFIIAAQGS